MSATVPRELMVLVERVVRPLPVPFERQKRLRAEFLGHLQGVFAEELARYGDQSAALTRTTQRFGDPAALSAELRQTVPLSERVLAKIGNVVGQRLDESTMRYAVRMTLLFCAVAAPSLALAITARRLDDHGDLWVTLPMALLGLSIVLSVAIWFGSFLLFGLQIGAEWNRPVRRWSRLVMYTIGLAGSWYVSQIIFMTITGADWPPRQSPQVTAILGGLASVTCGIVVGLQYYRETLYRREWEELDLDAA